MKVDDLPAGQRRATRSRVLEYLETHPDEVFRIRQCDEVAEALAAPKRTVEHAFWSLEREGLISKARLDREIWYGSHPAIEELTSLRTDAQRLSAAISNSVRSPELAPEIA